MVALAFAAGFAAQMVRLPPLIGFFAAGFVLNAMGFWRSRPGHDCQPHTICRTKASLIYRRTKNIRAVQLLLVHSKLESTVRYLGTEVEDALELSEQTEI